jgi:MFS family permease
MSYGLSFWLPSYVGRSLGLDLRATALLLGGATLIGGSISMLASGMLADWLEQRGRRGYALVPLWGCVGSLVILPIAISASSFAMALIALTILFVFAQAYAPPTLALIQNYAPANMRTTISAVFMLVVNLMGAGLGPALLGKVSDVFTSRIGPGGLGYAIVAGGTVFFGLAAAFYAIELRLMARPKAA